MEFKEGQIVSLYVTEIREINEEKFIFLSDGQKDTYKVLPFDFQLDLGLENLPKTLKCYVKSVNIYGLPFLQQSRKDILETCYTDFGTEYPFKLVAISEKGTNPTHYFLKDSFGIRHRYYPLPSEPKREVNDIFSLVVEEIVEKEGNKSHLGLRPVQIGDPKEKKGENIPIDPRIDSKFGVEGSRLEFKSTIVFPAGGIEPDIDKQLGVILKTIAAFQNSEGGTLYIGVNDSGTVVGIEYDFPYLNSGEKDIYKNYTPTIDHYELKIRNAIRAGLGPYSNSNVSFDFLQEEGKTYCKIEIRKSLYPVFRSDSKLFQRAGNMIQILQKDEITWFIEDRLRLREGNKSILANLSKNIIQSEHEELEELKPSNQNIEIAPASLISVPSSYIRPKSSSENDSKVWFWMFFNNDGTWSFGRNQINSSQIVYQLPIINSHKRERLIMVYKNGCVNVVNPYDMIMTKSSKGGRKQKTIGKIYQNGWNTKSEILKMYSANKEDYIFFRSKQANGNEWIKVHRNNAISVHTGLALEGNVLINPKLKASIEQVENIESAYFPIISSLVLKDHQTSGYLGFRTNESAIKLAFSTIEKLVEKQISEQY